MPSDGQYVTPDVDQRVADILFAQQFCGTVQRVAFGVAAQINLHEFIFALRPVMLYGDVAHLRVGMDQFYDFLFIRLHGLEFIGMETP